MMRASEFQYLSPRTAAEAVQAFAEHEDAMYLAGGTDLVPNMKRRQQTPTALVSLRYVDELREIHNGSGVSLGAGLTLATIARDRKVQEHYPALLRAAAQVATPHIRNMGTIGGNLCLDTRCNYYNQNEDWRQAIDYCMKAPRGRHVTSKEEATGAICWVAPGSPRCWAVSSTDTAPALVALGAKVELVGTEGARTIDVLDLFRDDGMDYLAKKRGELLTRVLLPPPGGKSTYWKLRRRGSFDFPVLGVGAWARFGKDEKTVDDVRLVLGAVASHPILVDASQLVGGAMSDDAIDAVADAATRVGKPLDNTDFALGWRKKVIRSFVRGALRELRGDDISKLGPLARRGAAFGPLPVLG